MAEVRPTGSSFRRMGSNLAASGRTGSGSLSLSAKVVTTPTASPLMPPAPLEPQLSTGSGSFCDENLSGSFTKPTLNASVLASAAVVVPPPPPRDSPLLPVASANIQGKKSALAPLPSNPQPALTQFEWEVVPKCLAEPPVKKHNPLTPLKKNLKRADAAIGGCGDEAENNNLFDSPEGAVDDEGEGEGAVCKAPSKDHPAFGPKTPPSDGGRGGRSGAMQRKYSSTVMCLEMNDSSAEVSQVSSRRNSNVPMNGIDNSSAQPGPTTALGAILQEVAMANKQQQQPEAHDNDDEWTGEQQRQYREPSEGELLELLERPPAPDLHSPDAQLLGLDDLHFNTDKVDFDYLGASSDVFMTSTSDEDGEKGKDQNGTDGSSEKEDGNIHDPFVAINTSFTSLASSPGCSVIDGMGADTHASAAGGNSIPVVVSSEHIGSPEAAKNNYMYSSQARSTSNEANGRSVSLASTAGNYDSERFELLALDIEDREQSGRMVLSTLESEIRSVIVSNEKKAQQELVALEQRKKRAARGDEEGDLNEEGGGGGFFSNLFDSLSSNNNTPTAAKNNGQHYACRRGRYSGISASSDTSTWLVEEAAGDQAYFEIGARRVSTQYIKEFAAIIDGYAKFRILFFYGLKQIIRFEASRAATYRLQLKIFSQEARMIVKRHQFELLEEHERGLIDCAVFFHYRKIIQLAWRNSAPPPAPSTTAAGRNKEGSDVDSPPNDTNGEPPVAGGNFRSRMYSKKTSS